MFPQFSILLLVISVVSCQINGEFWWLNNNTSNLRQGKAPLPIFDDVNELETDESIKIVFRDNDIIPDSKIKSKHFNNTQQFKNTKDSRVIKFEDKTELSKPLNDINNNDINEIKLKDTNVLTSDLVKKPNVSRKSEDVFQFVFPDDKLLWTKNQNISTGNNEKFYETIKRKINNINDKDNLQPENICTYVTKIQCTRSGGTLYVPWIKLHMQMILPEKQVMCCILPIVTTPISKVIFPSSVMTNVIRYKRSNVEDVSSALKQRNALMKRKYPSNDNNSNQRTGITTPIVPKTVTQKIVNSDESSTDPYWNIKNSNIRNPHIPMVHDPDSKYDYENQDYSEDYAAEFPKPGLIGLYSDHRKTQTSWLNKPSKGYSYDYSDSGEEEIETSFGYSTIDPRLGNRRTSPKMSVRGKPSKITPLPSDIMQNSESQTVNYHSYPDFHVLQGFKLMNLMRHKNRLVRETTTESGDECDRTGTGIKDNPVKLITNPETIFFENELFQANLRQKLYKDCGKKLKQSVDDCDHGREQGIVEFGEHPWILLVVSTKTQQRILCYATLVHARVAVTAAECVRGISSGEVSVIAGVLNIMEDVVTAQRRMVTVHLHPQHETGELTNNLALLYWKRPFSLDARVQPACLTQPHADDDCVFVGWGGYDQEIQSDLGWQRAAILTPQNCNKRLSKLEVTPPNEAFCAAVESQGTLTGVGGPLLCKNDLRWSAVGVAVWRDDVIILLPAHEWVLRTMASLRIH